MSASDKITFPAISPPSSSSPEESNNPSRVNKQKYVHALQSEALPIGYTPDQFDILCGRHQKTWSHEGNKRYKAIVKQNVIHYQNAQRKVEKSYFVAALVEKFRDSGCLFLKQDAAQGDRWFDIGDDAAREKTGHAIRDHIARALKKKKRRDAATAAPDSTAAAVKTKRAAGGHSHRVLPLASKARGRDFRPQNKYPPNFQHDHRKNEQMGARQHVDEQEQKQRFTKLRSAFSPPRTRATITERVRKSPPATSIRQQKFHHHAPRKAYERQVSFAPRSSPTFAQPDMISSQSSNAPPPIADAISSSSQARFEEDDDESSQSSSEASDSSSDLDRDDDDDDDDDTCRSASSTPAMPLPVLSAPPSQYIQGTTESTRMEESTSARHQHPVIMMTTAPTGDVHSSSNVVTSGPGSPEAGKNANASFCAPAFFWNGHPVAAGPNGAMFSTIAPVHMGGGGGNVENKPQNDGATLYLITPIGKINNFQPIHKTE
mmetsp:Transcript_6820/g.19973  ORF Transcript_6820/g.19973 Transcript_6820/m.19973 type:complete len:489 (+) Transcript_6820:178-1644(+)|eukprot:CAMPEP_0119565332 /NCGR_PEP_ID=MMETSP1352-20130426/29627_1 /TAXON_ID=265584 /ORGANISM="Stauroneis constricta, Strain CCMP1120" /LENGTH=488 /DNA_ID=CAMNT_0007614213 /DNA_START=127 /DNA_END=1593 /DNA_ORIENTATION=+